MFTVDGVLTGTVVNVSLFGVDMKQKEDMCKLCVCSTDSGS